MSAHIHPERLQERGVRTYKWGGRVLPLVLILAGMDLGTIPKAWGQGAGASTSAGISGGQGGPIVADGTAAHEGRLGHSRVNTRVNSDGSALSSAGALGVGADGSVALSKTYVFRASDGTLIGGDFQLGVDPSGRGQVNLGSGVVPGGHPGGGGALGLGGSVQRGPGGWTGGNRAEASRDDRFGPGRGPVRVATESRSFGRPIHPALDSQHGGQVHPTVISQTIPRRRPGWEGAVPPRRIESRPHPGSFRGGFVRQAPIPGPRW